MRSGGREHKCGAIGCVELIPIRHLMCVRHWVRLPRPLQEAINLAYQPASPSQSREWCALVKRAIRLVHEKELAPV